MKPKLSMLKLLVLLVLAVFLISCNENEIKTQPNILLIISDDQGYGDFGFTGNQLADTPVLNKLSREGAFYSNFIVAPACTPTRSALMTGRNHLDIGVWGVGSRGKVRRDETLMPQFFNSAGYHTWAFGKMDGGIRMMEIFPNDRGIDFFSTTGDGGKCTSPVPGYCHLTENGWVAELITDAAIEKIETVDDKPWFMQMAYIIPHLPWLCPDSYADPYRQEGYSEDFAQLYGSIKQMDDQIGRLLDALDETGQAKNTIVLFLSDNGPTESILTWVNNNFKDDQNSEDWDLRNACGLIGHKAEVWDNGIRSPLLVRWPRKIKPGVRKHVTQVEDILPTLLDIADISVDSQPKHYPFDGKSFRTSLEDAGFAEDRDIFRIALAGPGAPDQTTSTGIITDAREVDYDKLHTVLRNGNYKFHHLPGGIHRLYKMDADPGEKKNLSRIMPELTAAMAQRCRARWDDIASRNRTFPMRQLKINNADRPQMEWKIPVLQPLRLEGEMRVHPWLGGVKGFRFPGDRADYSIEVQKPLSGFFVAEGTGFNDCAPISLLVDNEVLAVESRSAVEIVFRLTELHAGTVQLSLVVNDEAERGKQIGEVINLTFVQKGI